MVEQNSSGIALVEQSYSGIALVKQYSSGLLWLSSVLKDGYG